MSQMTAEYEITRKVPESIAKKSLARLFEADSHVILNVDGQFEIGTHENNLSLPFRSSDILQRRWWSVTSIL